MKKILVVDNQISTCSLLKKFLSKEKYEVETITQGHLALAIMKKQQVDIVICEYRLPDIDADEFFEKALKTLPDVFLIFMGQEVNLKNAIDSIKKGACNFLSKPLNPDELLEAIRACSLRERTAASSVPFVGRKPTVQENGGSEEFDFVVGESREAVEMVRQIKRVGTTNFTVIIEGETGTGKEAVARLIHKVSDRSDQPFVAVDCGSLSKEIAGSELFGHEKGAFTGAVTKKTGLFELANGGTIFLDEIANLSPETQMALLRALQEKRIRKIGGVGEVSIDVRVIAATNEDLIVKSGSSFFREDLFYRLSEFILKVPTLKQRISDLPLFINYFLSQVSEELRIEKPQLSEEVKRIFYRYEWPGNIRELKNVIRRACLFIEKDQYIYKSALPAAMLVSPSYKHLDETNNGKAAYQVSSVEPDLKSAARQAEITRIMEVLEKVNFNKTKAAKILNIHRKTLYSKLKVVELAN
ncbi:two-component system, NtrC family, response regulator HydG [Cyclobacterium xiamenense]|uniref:Two-component system, NtrC family, response regulator HydG n=1 Tax=Cyclobacterium xiamenense TaxID=1297121 RepID=A0A1H6Z5L6_9BACT|nr:sigma-54 dependent transcriptional regulator [Cyclobacterium xiamenense]SEJ47986.1 two-component system, NtrC family, response regulator HydG [Cyclobacterium xiamenense]